MYKTSTTLVVGETKTLISTVSPEDATDKSVIWTSDDESVASVDSEGKITAVAQGTAIIVVATHDGGKIATCEVNVISQSYIVATANATSNLSLLGLAKPDLQYSIDGTNWSKYNAPINITQGQIYT